MRALFVAMLASGLCLAGCGQAADSPSVLETPAAPTAVTGSGSAAARTAAPGTVEVPFRSEVTWTKVVNGGDPGPCQGLHGNPPNGMIYLMRNTNEGVAVSTHLGTGDYVNHTCVYGRIVDGKPAPAGWLADVRWTAANGDELYATSAFVRWVITPEARVAIENVTFRDGETGRFAFAEGQAECQVNVTGPLARTATYEGTLRYGKKEK